MHDYQVIISASPVDLSKQINKKFEEGYQTVGGICVVSKKGYGYSQEYYVQAVAHPTRYFPPNKPIEGERQ